MNYLQITRHNLEKEHICCALGSKQYEEAVIEKKKWLDDRMEEGLVFYRLDERAKVFIEYLPAENAWIPIHAPNFMYINCLWVAGKYKHEGHARTLLKYCKEDAVRRGMDGIVHIVGEKNIPYLSEKAFFLHMGFEVVDSIEPYFQLVAQSWNNHAVSPSFNRETKINGGDDTGVTIYYTAQCPYAVGVLEDLQKVVESKDILFKAYKIRSREEAQRSPTVWTTFSLYYDGQYITHEIISPNKLNKMLDRLLQNKIQP